VVALRKTLDADDQVGMDESAVIDNPEVEQALEERQLKKEALAEHRLAYKNADKRAKSLIEGLTIADPDDEETPTVVRVTRFRIIKRFVKGRSVTFETQPRIQLSIGLADEPDTDDVVDPRAEDTAEEAAAMARLDAEQAYPKPALVAPDDSDAPVIDSEDAS
jgi:hypothetical protein